MHPLHPLPHYTTMQRIFGREISGNARQRHQLSHDQRVSVITQSQDGKSGRQIARETRFSEHAIRSCINHYNTTSQVDLTPRTGRPPKVSLRTERQIIRFVNRFSKLKHSQVIKQLQSSVHKDTLRRILRKNHITKMACKESALGLSSKCPHSVPICKEIPE
ncbi:hypothetical protein B0J12DRAFT_674135 [Macrophomina phaseolina]|uniref:Transposase Tc1-like domain-containing protein n=1 Tax=Macrophomina phaseolina TaxID=35725 RepID=A0ABQ8G1T1_9PEZI|nr:hypothetical protein B0J12DRAFT_674135 [Macrophomina phaseolina]